LIEQRNRADRERAKAEQVARLLVQSFEAAAPATAKGRVVTARDILDSGASRIDRELRNQPELQATMLRTLAEVYADIGESKRALELVERAIQRRGGSEADRAERVRDAIARGRITYDSGEGEKAMRLLESAREMQRNLTPGDLELRGSVQTALASVYTLRANFAGAEQALKDAIEARRRLGDQIKLAESLGELAHVYLYLGRYREAVGLLRNAHEIGVRINGEMDAQSLFHAMLLSNCLQGAGEDEEAVRWGEYALERLRKIYGDRRQIGPALTVLATAYRRVERLEDSRRMQELNLEILRRENAVNSIPAGLHMLAVSHYFLGQHAEFRRLFSEGLRQARALGTASGQQGLYYGVALRQQGDLAPALFELQWVRDAEAAALPPNHPGRAGYHIHMGAGLMDAGLYAKAQEELELAQQLQTRALRPGHYFLDYVDILRADCRLSSGDTAAARRIGERAAAELPRKHRSAEAVAASFLGRLALASGDAPRAIAHLRRAVELEQQPSRYHDLFSRALAEASLAKALRLAGRAAEAESWAASAARVLELYPMHPRLHAAVRELDAKRGAVQVTRSE
jgi:serine/threonine-protein kinase